MEATKRDEGEEGKKEGGGVNALFRGTIGVVCGMDMLFLPLSFLFIFLSGLRPSVPPSLFPSAP